MFARKGDVILVMIFGKKHLVPRLIDASDRGETLCRLSLLPGSILADFSVDFRGERGCFIGVKAVDYFRGLVGLSDSDKVKVVFNSIF